MFREYQHIEKLNTIETEDILIGTVYVFPKIDGTASSVWKEDNGEMKCGSRHRVLSMGSDNAGFYSKFHTDSRLHNALAEHPEWTIYGEFLIKHTLNTYREDAWGKFYIYDVHNGQKWLPYDIYSEFLISLGLDVIPPLKIISNPKEEYLYKVLDENTYLIKDGAGAGEGIVLKNYDWRNKFGRQTWAKLVRTEFKESNQREFKTKVQDGGYILEEDIASKYITETLVNKVYANIVTQHHRFSSSNIQQFLNTVWYDFIREEMWDVLKKFKNPTIDFKVLNKRVILQIKKIKPELF